MQAKRKILGFPKPDLLVSTQNFQIFNLLTCLHVAYNTISLFLLLITDANVSIFIQDLLLSSPTSEPTSMPATLYLICETD